MNKKISLGAAIAYMAIVAALTISITMMFSMRLFSDKVHSVNEREAMYDKLAEIDQYTRQHFFGTIDEAKLMDNIAKGYVAGLGDAYARYLDANEYTRLTMEYDRKNVGVGFLLEPDLNGYLVVKEVYPNSPAQSAGIQTGDLVVKINNDDVSFDNVKTIKNNIIGEAGTKVSLVVRRGTDDTAMELTRRYVEIPVVSSKRIGDAGYIRIKEFTDLTPEQFNKQLDKLISDGVTGLIIDVRNNNGGTVKSVAKVLDRLLPAGDIVSAEYNDGKTEVLEVSDAIEISLPMVVLANEKTISAAELFAQAIKDYNKGKVVGTTTFGKGLMQTIYQLTDGSAIEITIGKYNPPKSPNFNGIGVKPDFEVKLTADQEKVFEFLNDTTDLQLKKAQEVLAAAVKSNSDTNGSA